MDPKIVGAFGVLIMCCICSSIVSGSMSGGETIEETKPVAGAGADDSGTDDVEDCDVAKTDWINSKLQEDGMPQSQGESLQNCKVPENLQARIVPVACDVAKTDWINSKLQEDGMPQSQGESLQNCKVPENLQARIQ